MRQYEIMLILPPDAEDAAVEGVLERIRGILGGTGGEVTSVDKWGRRRLAHEIDRNTEGYYVVAQFRAEPDAIGELDRSLTLADEVLRFKVVVRGDRAA